MNFIAAVDKNWAIGNKGKLLARISEDQKYFRNVTMGHVVVLGRKTLEEFPNKKPLSGRTNIILSRNNDYAVEGATVVHSFDELMDELKKYTSEDIFIIGGQTVYDMMVPYCDKAYITKIYKEYDADAFIPNIDNLESWKLEASSDLKIVDNLEYSFNEYINTNPMIFENNKQN